MTKTRPQPLSLTARMEWALDESLRPAGDLSGLADKLERFGLMPGSEGPNTVLRGHIEQLIFTLTPSRELPLDRFQLDQAYRPVPRDPWERLFGSQRTAMDEFRTAHPDLQIARESDQDYEANRVRVFKKDTTDVTAQSRAARHERPATSRDRHVQEKFDRFCYPDPVGEHDHGAPAQPGSCPSGRIAMWTPRAGRLDKQEYDAAVRAKFAHPEALTVDARNEDRLAGADKLCERLVLERDVLSDTRDFRLDRVFRYAYSLTPLGVQFLGLAR